MNILVIHTNYVQFGGEDAVVRQEVAYLKKHYNVECLYFQNQKGLHGLFQFFMSIWNIRSARVLKKRIKTFRPDIIHLHNWHFAAGPIVIRTAKKQGVPIVHTLHNYRLICPSATLFHNNNLFLTSMSQYFPWSAILKKVYKNSMLLTFWLSVVVWTHKKIGTWKMINTYICLTPTAIDLFLKSKLNIPQHKFVSKPNFSVRNSKSETYQRSDHFLFIGRLIEEKGILFLIDVFKETPYQLKIVGDGPLRKAIIDQLEQVSNISYLGKLTQDAIANELKTANALIVPSIWLEPFGLVITEAFSNSCAVISSNIGAPKSLIENGKNGIHFKPNSKKDLIEALSYWYSMSFEEKQIMRENAFNTFLEKYAPEKQEAYFSKIYTNTLENK